MDENEIQVLEKRKKWLKRYKKNIALIDRLEEKLLELDTRIYDLKSKEISDMPRGGVPVDTVDLLADKEELKERITRLNRKGRGYKSEILEKIDDLDDTRYAEILEAFFIDCKTFDQIANDNGYTTRHVIRLYSEAILDMSF